MEIVRSRRFGARVLATGATACVLVFGAAAPAHAATGRAVTGPVTGTTKYVDSECSGKHDAPETFDETQSFTGKITTPDGSIARINAATCVHVRCYSFGCDYGFDHGTFTITKGAAQIRGAVRGGPIGETKKPNTAGFRMDLVVRSGSAALASVGTKLKFTGWWTVGDPNTALPMKGHVALA